jgi:hypothetical protein
LDVIGAYYHYIQNSFFGTAAGGPSSAPAASMRNAPGRTMQFLPDGLANAEVGSLSWHDVQPHAWWIGLRPLAA